jgi:hypothetical protein
MIRFQLICEAEHAFDGWFASGDSADMQLKRGLVTCPTCGTTYVQKALMAPSLSGTKKSRALVIEHEDAPAATSGASLPVPVEPSTPETLLPVTTNEPTQQELRQALRELKTKLLEGSENVGEKFADEARKIHFGDAEHRTIHGRATLDEARALREEGVAFGPLPVLPDEMN